MNKMFKEHILTEEYKGLPEQVKTFFDRQYRDSYECLDASRHPVTGLYADTYLTSGVNPDFRSSIAATGVGLIGLCVAELEGWDDRAAEKAMRTMLTLMGQTDGCQVARDPSSGFFAHFVDMSSGENLNKSELGSTIDTAILIAGALFAGSHFKDKAPQINAMATELLHSIDWRMIVADKTDGSMYMIVQNGEGSKVTHAYNEYVITAYLAMLALPDDADIQEFWNNTYAEERLDAMPINTFRDYPVLTNSRTNKDVYLSSFVHQFPFYLIPEYGKSQTYRSYYENACQADRLKWKEMAGVPSYVWGFGAGSNTGLHGGYHADKINRSPGHVASAYIVAGFLPVYPAGIYDLYALYQLHIPYDTYRNPTDPAEENKFRTAHKYGLHRYSWQHLELPDRWYPERVTLIDWSSLLYGLAAFKRGMSFFTDRHY